jgi:potassium channel subfamily K
VLYFFIASLMVVTVWGAYRGQYDKQFQLTMSQRTLMLQTISFLMYLLLGSLVYSHIEGWLFHDAVYWADFTLLTIGIGNYAPMTHLGRGLLFPYAIGGIIILGLVIGSVRSLVLDRGKAKMEASMVEKERRRLLDKLQKKNKADILQPITKENTPVSRGSTMPIQGDSADFASAERSRRKEEFRLMRKIQEKATSRERWAALLISGSTWLLLWIVGAAIFEACEKDQNWSYFVSLYFSYTSLLTIGYGDFYPESNSGKAFFVFWSLLAVPSLTILISNMGDTVIKEIRDLTIWIGNFTVLPGERGVRVLLKEAAHKVTGGRIFNDSVIEIPPGILGENNKRVRDEGIGEGGDESRNDRRSTSPRAAGLEAQQEANATEKYGKRYERLPQSRRHYHSLLIKEIGLVIKHLKSSPPRKYTFEEWAWYLKLIGEDESFADLHNRPSKKPVSDGAATGIAKADKGGQEKWSWVGDRSPLIGQKDESEWVLERLTKMLDRELEEMKDEMDGERDLPMDGSWRRESTHDRDDGPLPDNSHSPVEDKAKGGS